MAADYLCDVLVGPIDRYIKGGASRITVEIAPEHWAPGIFCGVEGQECDFWGINFKVHTVDLVNRTVCLERYDR